MVRVIFIFYLFLLFTSCQHEHNEGSNKNMLEGKYSRYFDPFLFKPMEVLDEKSLTYPYFEKLSDTTGECIGFNFHFIEDEVNSDLLKDKDINRNYRTFASEYLIDKSSKIKKLVYKEHGHGIGTFTLLYNDSICVQRKILKIDGENPGLMFYKYYFKDSMITFERDHEFDVKSDNEINFIMPKHDFNVFKYVRHHYFTKKDDILEVRTVEKSKNQSKTFYNYFPAKNYDAFTLFLLEDFEYRFGD